MPKRKPVPPAFVPYAAQNPATVLGGRFGRVYVLAPSFCGVRAVERLCQGPEAQFGVRERYIPRAQLHHYTPLDPEVFPLQSFLEELKSEMLLHGATPEAVMLVGAVSPFTEEELNTMAKKLETPATKKPAAKAASAKTAAPKAEKAAAGPDNRKIKVVKKPHGAREGTTRAALLDTIYKSKTVQEAVDAGVTKSDVSWAARAGYIEIA